MGLVVAMLCCSLVGVEWRGGASRRETRDEREGASSAKSCRLMGR